MRILYPIEEHDYTLDEMKGFTGNVGDLQDRNIVKKTSDLYKFDYVGIIVDKVQDNTNILIVLPKYLENIVLSNDEEKEYAKLLMQVFRRYAKDTLNKDNLDDLDYLSENTQFNLLAIIDYLINDYIENGLYSNNLETHEYNGNGLIDWNKTIQDEFALITNRRVIYTDFHTMIDEDDVEDYIRILHQNILFQCFSFLEEISFLDLLEYPSLYIKKAELLIKDIEYQIRAIDIEIRNVFSDRKINLLKAMKYFLQEESRLESNNLFLYGTRSFAHIWEKSISCVFNNQIDLFKDLLPSPQWTKRESYRVMPSRTLKPDTVRQINNDFFVVDAKYYKFPFTEESKLSTGNPGLGDISKQFLYVEAFRTISTLGSCIYHNSFVLPTADSVVSNIGEINFYLFPNDKIELIVFPAKRLFEMYVSRTILTDVEIISDFC